VRDGYLMKFAHYFSSLTKVDRQEYIEKYPEHEDWKGYYDKILSKSP